jgi:hypothetical protein
VNISLVKASGIVLVAQLEKVGVAEGVHDALNFFRVDPAPMGPLSNSSFLVCTIALEWVV